ncbi:hypothetical protein AVEN_223336-1 [Araneus ventricosus]|uniref:Peptidase S1 domain-containing protein n=1 Tax=Araneus ventricosus TaxID=182803 RepID=A0A4Y2XDP9_ARAVE|nr:hypothetical protein AVEN_223336-1 [Araneus ventricosus]
MLQHWLFPQIQQDRDFIFMQDSAPPHFHLEVQADRTCSGSIISKKYILTSAYCLTKSESDNDPKCRQGKMPKACYVQNTNMKLRMPWRDSTKFRKTLQAEKLLPHPDYKHPAEKNDIALILVSQGIECNSFHQPICLPTENLNKFGGKLIVTGWGQVTPDGRTDGSKVLREGEMKQVKFSNCKLIPVNSSNVICVVGTNGAQMPCRVFMCFLKYIQG